MALRFQKRIKIAPGVRVNLSKTGVSASLGKPGATVNIGKKGVQGTAGIPGTGLSYRSKIGKAGQTSSDDTAPPRQGRSPWLIGLGLFVGISATLYWLI